jgi:hypothetical protein
MARLAYTNQDALTSTNPTTYYLKWKSNEKNFEWYNKETKEKHLKDLPLKFVFLQHYHTVKGFHEATNSNIYSNEVRYIGREKMNVRTKGKEIVSGIYKQIKAEINAAGGQYHRSVYVMLEDGTVVNIAMKGAVVKNWSLFLDESKNLVDNQWVTIESSKDEKKGSVKYSVPVFTLGSPLTSEESNAADNAVALLKVHMDAYFEPKEVAEEEEEDLDIEI